MTNKELIKNGIGKSVDYNSYETSFEALSEGEKVKGIIYQAMYDKYFKLNWSRHKRFEKKVEIEAAVLEKLSAIDKPQTWLVITEPWCGDSAASLPVIQKMSELSEHIELKIVYRDQYMPLIKAFLTGASMAIPKLLVLDENDEVLNTWGARPAAAQKLMDDFKQSGDGDKEAVYTAIQKWYTKDKGSAVQNEIIELI